jgi:hypothetical protein
MEDEDWKRVQTIVPSNGVVVETKIDDERGERNVAKLKRQNRLWFMPDGSMYVYYTPTHWRPLSPSP